MCLRLAYWFSKKMRNPRQQSPKIPSHPFNSPTVLEFFQLESCLKKRPKCKIGPKENFWQLRCLSKALLLKENILECLTFAVGLALSVQQFWGFQTSDYWKSSQKKTKMQNWIKQKILAVKMPLKSPLFKGKRLGVSELRGGVGTIRSSDPDRILQKWIQKPHSE